MKYLYNNTQNAKIWNGQTINANEYFLIPNSVASENFSNDDLVISDLSTGDLIVSRTNNLEGNISSPAEAINFLKDINSLSNIAPFSSKTLSNGKKLYKRLHGSNDEGFTNPFFQVAAGATEIIDVEVGYGHAKIEAMEIIGAGEEHSCELKILDDGDGSYSGTSIPNFELNQFSFHAGIAKGFHRFHSKYDADLYLGMIVSVEITNHSQVASKCALNIELNEVV